MYPSSKSYLQKAGFSASTGGWVILGCFVTGFVGIQVVTRFLHHYIPSHVVDCDHNHDDMHSENRSHQHSQSQSRGSRGQSCHQSRSVEPLANGNGNDTATESSPLLNGDYSHDGASHSKPRRSASFRGDAPNMNSLSTAHEPSSSRRPSMVQVQRRVMSFVKDTKDNCDEGGPCFGYSDPCGQECFKHIGSASYRSSRYPTLMRTATRNLSRHRSIAPEVIEENGETETSDTGSPITGYTRVSRAQSRDPVSIAAETFEDEDPEAQHHHHVPENPFLSIGLQTSIAIALHKLPEGFITYATNHANPSLGFTVFMALFIHNITEGFAMALPLYLALGSRVRAMFWSSLLGGISQPLGAGIAALWFKLAQHTDHIPGFAVYGCMFAVTAGIMTSVAIQLFMESLSLNHNTNLVTAFALIGMAIMGMSSALTAD